MSKYVLFFFNLSIILLILTFQSIAESKPDSTSKIDFTLAFDNNEIGDSIVARIGNKTITAREFLSSYEFGPAFPKREHNSKDIYLKYMINEKLLSLYGYSEKVDTTEEAKNLLRAISGDVMTDQMFMDEIFNKIKVKKARVDSAVDQKQISYQLKWIYAPEGKRLDFYTSKMKTGITFDSLFNLQLKVDSVFADSRSMETDKFDLQWRNPQFAQAVDTLKIGEVSQPIKGPDGFYIVKLVDIWKNAIQNQAEYDKDFKDAEFMIKKEKADKISDQYINNMMMNNKPVIRGKAFSVLRSYLGNYYLPKEKYSDWKLDQKLKDEINSLKVKDLKKLTLVKMNSGSITISDFILWFKPRENYMKFDEKSFNTFSASIESMIWQMVRDHLLVREAYSRDYQNNDLIKQQMSWWKDKIVYSIVRDQMANSVGLKIEEPSSLKSKNNDKREKLTSKLLHSILKLKSEYPISINQKLLNSLSVHDSNDPKAVDFYTIKRGGIYPHPAFPSIDIRWQTWE